MPAVPASRLVVGPHCRIRKAINFQGVGRALSAAKRDMCDRGFFRVDGSGRSGPKGDLALKPL